MHKTETPEDFLTIDGEPLEKDFFPKPRRRKAVTARALAANRANAKRSTGPRTDAGKEHSRRNAIKHGVLAEVAVSAGLEGDDAREDFERLLEELIGNLQPVGAMEELTVQKIAVYTWRLRRMLIWENREALRDHIGNKVRSERIAHGLYDIEDGIPSSVQKEMQREREVLLNAEMEVMSLPNCYTANVVTRYDSMINRVIDRALRELERMQARRRKQLERLRSERPQERARRDERRDASRPGRGDEESAPQHAAVGGPERPAQVASANDSRKSVKKNQTNPNEHPPAPREGVPPGSSKICEKTKRTQIGSGSEAPTGG